MTASTSQESKNSKVKRGAARDEKEKEEEEKEEKSKKDDVIVASALAIKSGDERDLLEKSFSDSDEEPLATKLNSSKQNNSKLSPKKRGRKSHQEIAETARKTEEKRQADALRLEIKALTSPKQEEKPKDTPQKSQQQKQVNFCI